MEKKYHGLLCFLAVLMVLMTGCATVGMDISVSENGKGTLQVTTKLDKEAYIEYLHTVYTDLGMESDVDDVITDLLEQGTCTEEVIDGRTYLVMDSSEGNTEFDSISAFYAQIGLNHDYELTETSFCISEDALTEEDVRENGYYDLSDMKQEDLEKYLGNSYLEFSVSFDYLVKETNGTIDAGNPKKVSWKYPLNSNVDRIYAYCDSLISFSGVKQGSVSQEPVTLHFEGAESAALENGQTVENDTTFSVDGTYCVILKNGTEQKTVYFAIDRTAPEFQDESGKEVSLKGYQKKERVIYLSDDGGILSADLDGTSVLECNLQDNEDFIYYVTILPSAIADGKHTLAVMDTYGNKKTITFKTDKTAPVVKGVKNKKIYRKPVTVKFSDSTSGIKKAALNGKKIKSGTKIKNAGSYTLHVKDQAGNLTTVKFKIREKAKKKKSK